MFQRQLTVTRHDSRIVIELSILLTALIAFTACADSAPAEDDGIGANPGAVMDTTPAGTPAPPSPAVVQEDQARTVTARLFEWEIELSRDTVPAGEITFTAMNTGTMEHALEVEGPGVEEETEPIPPGETATLTVTLEPGSYEVYCPITGEYDHQAKGMETTLIVQ
ncbi:MAG TPA: cupredoxin domain-containing protein [Longimicrobiaceae bacterium]|nr:cupredoxin domain-containing protein [Longimicrobiaceae bacterium]